LRLSSCYSSGGLELGGEDDWRMDEMLVRGMLEEWYG